MKKTTGVLFLVFAMISALLLSSSGCVFPEYESEDISYTTSRITYTTGRIETDNETDSPDPENLQSLTGKVVNVRSYVHIRAGADLSEDIISTAQNDDLFPVNQVYYEDNWHMIIYEDQIAFIHADYFEILYEDENLVHINPDNSDTTTSNGDTDLTDENTDHNPEADDLKTDKDSDDLEDGDEISDDPVDQDQEGVG